MDQQIGISLSLKQSGFIRSCFREVQAGASSRAILNTLRRNVGAIEHAQSEINFEESYWVLKKETWFLIFDLINANIYALGPSELATLTGAALNEAANINLKISEKIFGCYGGCIWDRKNA